VLFGSYFSSQLLVEISILFFFFHLKGTLVLVEGLKIYYGSLVLELVFHISISRLLILGFSKKKEA